MPSRELNFEEDNAIDLDDLHEEWRSHAGIRKNYADEVTHLEKVKQKAHEKVKVTRSRLIREAKEAKLSSADLREAYYREDKKYQEAKDEQIEAEYELGMAWNALNAFDDRKYALQDEVKLWIKNYFATPREERIVEGGKRIEDLVQGKKVQEHRGSLNETRKRKRKE